MNWIGPRWGASQTEWVGEPSAGVFAIQPSSAERTARVIAAWVNGLLMKRLRASSVPRLIAESSVYPDMNITRMSGRFATRISARSPP